MTIGKVLKDVFTETDSETYDHIRFLAVLSVVVGLVLQVYVVVRSMEPQKFDFQTFGIGIGAVFTGVGVALKLKPETKE